MFSSIITPNKNTNPIDLAWNVNRNPIDYFLWDFGLNEIISKGRIFLVGDDSFKIWRTLLKILHYDNVIS